MKPLVAVLHAVLVLTVTGSTPGKTSNNEKGCPIVLEDGESLYNILYNKLDVCLQQTLLSGLDILHLNATTEEIRAVFRDFCSKVPNYTLCMDSVTSDANVCLNKTEQTKFRLFHDFKVLDFKAGCVKNGSVYAEVYEAINMKKVGIFETCQRNAYAEVNVTDNEDINAHMFYEYKMMEKVIKCFEDHKGHGLDSLMDDAILIGRDVLDRMNCIKGTDDVLCKTIMNKKN